MTDCLGFFHLFGCQHDVNNVRLSFDIYLDRIVFVALGNQLFGRLGICFVAFICRTDRYLTCTYLGPNFFEGIFQNVSALFIGNAIRWTPTILGMEHNGGSLDWYSVQRYGS